MHIYNHAMKKYKPGQFLSIGGKLARASMTKDDASCDVCRRENNRDISWYCMHATECCRKLDDNVYPKFICGKTDNL